MLNANAYANDSEIDKATTKAAQKFVTALDKNQNTKAAEMILLDGGKRISPEQFVKAFYNVNTGQPLYSLLSFKFIKELNSRSQFSIHSLTAAPNGSFVLTIAIQRPKAQQYYDQYKRNFNESREKGLNNADYAKALDKYLTENIKNINFAYDTVYLRMFMRKEGKNWILSFPSNFFSNE